ncbi:MAG: hypothetical protein RJB38_1648 [Pseudomonadota bacterium]|jgi:hypothetical protein
MRLISRPLLSLLLAFTLGLNAATARAGARSDDDDFDRLDGKGRSGKKVDVIEWEGNLEIHVYPAGSVQGLAFKIDDRDPKKKVLVIGYRFASQPQEQLIRRAILGIPLENGFRVYRDPKGGRDYDKFVLTHHAPEGRWIAFRPDPEPQQLYPEGHPALLAQDSERPSAPRRQPASKSESEPPSSLDEETGAIRSKSW